MATAAKINLTAQTLGPTAAAVRSRVSAQRWRQIVHAAHKQGFAVDSFLDGNSPRPLKERTPSFLRQQAVSTVGTAYAPAYKELDSREVATKALDDKRAADNQYYLNWLNSQHQALTAAATASDSALQSAAQSIQASTGAAYDQAKQGAIQQLSQLPGTVSDFSHANALGGIDAAKATGVGQVGATANQGLAEIGTAQGMRALADANNFATIAALESKRVGDRWATEQGLTSDRLKLSSQQASDVSKAIQDALNQEVTKAQSNRDYKTVQQQLNVKQYTAATNAAAKRSNARHSAQTLAETIRYHNQLTAAKKDAKNTTDANAEANFEAKWGVSRQTFLGWSDAQRQSYLARARARGIISGGKKGSSGSGGATKVTQGNFNKAYAKLFGGSYDVPTKDPTTGKPTKKTVKFDPRYAQKNYNSLVNMLVSSGFDQKVADAAVHAFIQGGANGHPGSLRAVLQQIAASKGPGGAR